MQNPKPPNRSLVPVGWRESQSLLSVDGRPLSSLVSRFMEIQNIQHQLPSYLDSIAPRVIITFRNLRPSALLAIVSVFRFGYAN